MPIDPWGLGERAFETIRERVRKELGVDPNNPQQPGQPEDPGIWSRVRQRAREALGYTPTPPPQQPVYTGPPRNIAEVKQRIQMAGRHRPPLLLRVLYNGQWRDVEGYSYRYRDADLPQVPLFFGWCGKDSHIEAYKLNKIQDLQVTDRPFQPRFVVEF